MNLLRSFYRQHWLSPHEGRRVYHLWAVLYHRKEGQQDSATHYLVLVQSSPPLRRTELSLLQGEFGEGEPAAPESRWNLPSSSQMVTLAVQ